MGIGIWAFIAYIASIIIWNTVIKRNIGEAMGVGLIVVALFGGKNAVNILWNSFINAAQQGVVLAALFFVLMSYIMNKTGLIKRLVDILNALIGRVAGGPAYIATIASALFGMVSGSGTGNAATVGAITIPWMKNSNWSPEMAATITAGNAGLGIAIPPCSSMFIMLGFSVVAEKVNPGTLYIALFCAGLWTLLYRMILVRYFVYKYKIAPMPRDTARSLKVALSEGASSFLLFAGIIIPILITIGPFANFLGSVKSFGQSAVESMSIILWVPVLITIIALFEGRKYLPRKAGEWFQLLKDSMRGFSILGGAVFFAFAASYVLEKVGFGKDLNALLASLGFSPIIMVLIIGTIITIIAGPLSATATIVAIGGVAFTALTGVGINPAVAAAAVLIFSSTEGATPPSSAPIFISCGIANVEIEKTFRPLIIYYVIPIIIVGALIALGILPIYAG